MKNVINSPAWWVYMESPILIPQDAQAVFRGLLSIWGADCLIHGHFTCIQVPLLTWTPLFNHILEFILLMQRPSNSTINTKTNVKVTVVPSGVCPGQNYHKPAEAQTSQTKRVQQHRQDQATGTCFLIRLGEKAKIVQLAASMVMQSRNISV